MRASAAALALGTSLTAAIAGTACVRDVHMARDETPTVVIEEAVAEPGCDEHDVEPIRWFDHFVVGHVCRSVAARVQAVLDSIPINEREKRVRAWVLRVGLTFGIQSPYAVTRLRYKGRMIGGLRISDRVGAIVQSRLDAFDKDEAQRN